MHYLGKGKLVQALRDASLGTLHVAGVFWRSEKQTVLRLHIYTTLNSTNITIKMSLFANQAIPFL